MTFSIEELLGPKKTKQLPPLWAHQREAIARASKRFAFFFDPGCGKSRTAIEMYKKAYANSGKAIIFAPLSVCRNWADELEQYMDEPFETYIVSGQSREKKFKALKEFIKAYPHTPGNQRHVFLLCNLESLRAAEYRKLLMEARVKFFIVDESHNFKSPTSAQTKGLMDLLHYSHAEWVYLLTGTPAPQGEMDLYTTFKILGRTESTFFLWRKKNFEDKNARRAGSKGYYPNYVIRESAKSDIEKTLRCCSATAKKEEVLDLPELLRLNVYCELSHTQRKLYESMLEYFFAADVHGEELNATNVLTRSLRLQQIVSGYFEDDAVVYKNPRLDALTDAIGITNGQQFIVWTIFKSSYYQLADHLKKLGITYAFLTGDIPAEQRHENITNFQAGTIRALIAHPKAGGVGVNLTAAPFSIHYTRSYSLTDDLQTEARNYRAGSEIHDRITRIDIIADNTIDKDIVKALRDKKSVQDFILGLKKDKEQYDYERDKRRQRRYELLNARGITKPRNANTPYDGHNDE